MKSEIQILRERERILSHIIEKCPAHLSIHQTAVVLNCAVSTVQEAERRALRKCLTRYTTPSERCVTLATNGITLGAR